MTITAKVIAHSRADNAPDLITLECRYPRMIHSEFMTHRVFSRNASSSRAIPIERMIQDVIDDPAMPVAWGSNKPGMQAGEECNNPVDFGTHSAIESAYGVDYTTREAAWLIARDLAVESARAFSAAGYHKQIANRLLEPFGHISVVVTATEWDNFFELRRHPDADPTMRALAEAMWDAIEGSGADDLECDWQHLPYVGYADVQNMRERLRGASEWDGSLASVHKELTMISAARCARVSYLNHDGSNPDIEKDLKLASMLVASKHMSPFEHQAKAGRVIAPSNLVGWQQHRKILEVA